MRSVALPGLLVAAVVLSCSARTPRDGDPGEAARRAERHASRAGLFAPVAPFEAGHTAVPAPIVRAAHGRFVMRRPTGSAFFGAEGFTFSARAGSPIQLRVVDARGDGPHADATGSAIVHQLAGSAREDLATYERLAWDEIWPGVDMVVAPSPSGFRYGFVVSPGADPSRIALEHDGAVRVVDDGRGLVFANDAAEVRVSGLRAFAVDGAHRRPLVARFVVEGSAGRSRIGFAIEGWDGRSTLEIDPDVGWSTFLGGGSSERGYAAFADAAGNVYVAGETTSSDFPTAGDGGTASGTFNDAFVTKLSPTGALVWSTFLGGSSHQRAHALAVDGAGNVYVTGVTESASFPIVSGFDATYGGNDDGWVAKLDPAGALVWSTFLGGAGDDWPYGIAVDAAGNVHVVGETGSSDFPLKDAADSTLGDRDAFVTKLSPAGALVWSTFLGGNAQDTARDVALDASGSVLVVGSTRASNFPSTGGFDTTHGGVLDAFVTKLSAGGTLLWSSYLGGSQVDEAFGAAVDATGAVYVAGTTYSPEFPVTGGFDTSLGGGSDAFVTKVSGAGALVWSSYLGGSGFDRANAIAMGPTGDLFVTGFTTSSDYPLVAAFDTSIGSSDAFLTRIGASGTIRSSSFLGGASADEGHAIAVDARGSVYVTGYTDSSDFPSAGGFDTTRAGRDAFLFKLAGPGLECTSGSRCASGFCADGVCCDQACTGACVACTGAKKGSGADGVCAPVAAGTDPRDACPVDVGYPTSCRGDGLCDGAGACRTYALKGTACGATTCTAGAVSGKVCNGAGACETDSVSCAPFGCDGAACATTCTAGSGCAADAWCSSVGTCVTKGAAGSTCAAASECQSELCVDGVCCKTPCSGQCEACAEPGTEGTCVPVAGAPRGKRLACDGDPSSCGGACDGTRTDACKYAPSGKSCGSVCEGGIQTPSTCDGIGACTARPSIACSPFACVDGTTCGTTCSLDAHCASGFRCESGGCVPNVGTCSADGLSVQEPSGAITACGATRCKGGKCVEVCTETATDCAPGYLCNTGKCEPAAVEDQGGCSVGARPGAGSWSRVIVAMLSVVLFGVRRRPRAKFVRRTDDSAP